jgi:hypothetical protein
MATGGYSKREQQIEGRTSRNKPLGHAALRSEYPVGMVLARLYDTIYAADFTPTPLCRLVPSVLAEL